jgi:C-terminal peptidase prc
MRFFSLLLFFLAAAGPNALAQTAGSSALRGPSANTPLWSRGLDRVEGLYLERADLTATQLMDGVMTQLELDIPWLLVQADGDLYRLSFGANEEFAVLTLSAFQTVAEAFFSLQQLMEASEHRLPAGLDLEISIMKGIARSLDRHSKLLHGKKLVSFDKRLRGTLSGIGARMQLVSHRLTLKQIYEDTPADRAGLLAQDRILRIDDVSTLGMTLNDSIDLITGPRGSELRLLVERQEGAFSVEMEMTLVRAEIKIPNVTGRSLEKGIGLVRIDHFSERTVDNLRRVLDRLAREKGLEAGLVLDLRGNTGGSMIQSARAADLFLSGGELVRTEGPQGRKVRGLVHRLIAQPEARDYKMPLVILQNHRTASGAEILAGALQESGRALIVGGTSYGKGSVQKVYTLRKDARFKLTVARYLVSGYREIAGIGLKPDVPLGRLLLGEKGLQYRPNDLPEDGGLAPLFYVERALGWVPGLEGESRADYGLDLAQAILRDTNSASIRDLGSAAAAITERLRLEETDLLQAQMALRGLDWGEDVSGGAAPFLAEATLGFPGGAAHAGERVDLQVVAWNKGQRPLARLVAVLSSSDRVFDGLRIPLGWVGPGEEVEKSIQLNLPAGRTGRESQVLLYLEDARGRRIEIGEQILNTVGSGPPALALGLKWERSGADDSVQIQLSNSSEQKLTGVRVRFLHAESAGIELLQFESVIGTLSAGARGSGRIAFKPEQGLDRIPLRILVEAEGFGSLIEWDLTLEKNAEKLHLQAPVIRPVFLPHKRKAGAASLQFRVEDDGELESVIGFVGGKKMAYVAPESPALNLILEVILDEGPNSVAVRAVDKQGLTSTRSWIIHGLEVSATTEIESD